MDNETSTDQLTLLGIPATDPDTNQPLTLEQRLKLLELEMVGTKRAGIDPIKGKPK